MPQRRGDDSHASQRAAPVWATASQFATFEENRFRMELNEVEASLTRLSRQRQHLRRQLRRASRFRQLLYAQDKPLETVILEVLRLLAFEIADVGRDFRFLFTSSEGSWLCEIDSNEDTAIDARKIRGLVVGMQRLLQRADVKPKVVLFGNAYCRMPLEVRGAFFERKCTAAAALRNIALVRAPDLFPIARYLKEHHDEWYARRCREAIAAAGGKVVAFPNVPTV